MILLVLVGANDGPHMFLVPRSAVAMYPLDEIRNADICSVLSSAGADAIQELFNRTIFDGDRPQDLRQYEYKSGPLHLVEDTIIISWYP